MKLSLPTMNTDRSDIEYSSELLIILMEECAEVTQACSKVLRYGNTSQNMNNLITNVGELECMIQLLASNIDISKSEMDKAIHNKKKKLFKWSNLNVGAF